MARVFWEGGGGELFLVWWYPSRRRWGGWLGSASLAVSHQQRASRYVRSMNATERWNARHHKVVIIVNCHMISLSFRE